MRDFMLDFAIFVGLLCGLVLAVDTAPRVVAGWRRRRMSRGGAFGVVVARDGRVLGTYLDPFGHPWRTPRVHGPESPWVGGGADSQPHAWEGFGATEEEAFNAANRLRRRQLQLFAWLEDDEHGEDDWLRVKEPYVPEG